VSRNTTPLSGEMVVISPDSGIFNREPDLSYGATPFQ
jgi:hypothetical protein